MLPTTIRVAGGGVVSANDVALARRGGAIANVTVDGKSYGAMGTKALPVEWRLQQGKQPKILD